MNNDLKAVSDIVFSRPQLTVVGGVAGIGKTTFVKRLRGEGSLFINLQEAFCGDVNELQAMWKSNKRTTKCATVVIIDSLDMISNYEKRETRSTELGDIIRELKRWQMRAGLNVIVTCGVNRDCFKREDWRPRLYELRGSGDIEETADLVILLHRPCQYDPECKPNMTEVMIAKNRHGIPLLFGVNDD